MGYFVKMFSFHDFFSFFRDLPIEISIIGVIIVVSKEVKA